MSANTFGLCQGRVYCLGRKRYDTRVQSDDYNAQSANERVIFTIEIVSSGRKSRVADSQLS